MAVTVGEPVLEGTATTLAPRDVVVSEADRAHWEQVRRWRARTLPEPTAPTWFDRARRVVGVGLRVLPAVDTGSLAGTAVGVAGSVIGDVGDVLEAVGVVAVTERVGELGTELGRLGLQAAGIAATFRRAGHDVGELADVATLEVDDVLATRPPLAPPYVLVAAAASGAFALLPGLASVVGRYGATVAGLAGALGLAAGTSADTVLAAATCTRAVTVTGAYYGYDAVGPDGRERAIALAVLWVSVADGSDKHSADDLLRALQAGGAPPPPAVLAHRLTSGLGARLRVRGVAGIVHATPVLGVGIAALLAARLLVQVLDDADHLYRERFLRDKYGLRPCA